MREPIPAGPLPTVVCRRRHQSRRLLARAIPRLWRTSQVLVVRVPQIPGTRALGTRCGSRNSPAIGWLLAHDILAETSWPPPRHCGRSATGQPTPCCCRCCPRLTPDGAVLTMAIEEVAARNLAVAAPWPRWRAITARTCDAPLRPRPLGRVWQPARLFSRRGDHQRFRCRPAADCGDGLDAHSG